MRLDTFFYGLSYRFGNPRWDSDKPRPELASLVGPIKPGRALDLGCGTGTDGIYLASRGWQVVGVDFAPQAISRATEKATAAGSTAAFVVGDVTRLEHAPVRGPFDLVLDVGCYHAIAEGRRDAYAAGVAALAGPGADFYLAGIHNPPAIWRLLGARGVSGKELRSRFGGTFDLTEEKPFGRMGRRSNFVLYHLVRKAA